MGYSRWKQASNVENEEEQEEGKERTKEERKEKEQKQEQEKEEEEKGEEEEEKANDSSNKAPAGYSIEAASLKPIGKTQLCTNTNSNPQCDDMQNTCTA